MSSSFMNKIINTSLNVRLGIVMGIPIAALLALSVFAVYQIKIHESFKFLPIKSKKICLAGLLGRLLLFFRGLESLFLLLFISILLSTNVTGFIILFSSTSLNGSVGMCE